MAILSLDFFESDPSKMDQTRKFGKQTTRILEFKPEGLDFYNCIKSFTVSSQSKVPLAVIIKGSHYKLHM